MLRRVRNERLIVVLAGIVGLVLVALSIVYFSVPAGSLPSLLPGHQAGSAHHHIKHALAAFGLALLAWTGAWLTTGKRTHHAT